VQRWLESVWYDATGRKGRWLRPLAAVFGGVVALRAAAYRRGLARGVHPGIPVVVIGNLTVGGTGKTPFTIWLAQELRARGVTPGLLARGYGGAGHGARRVEADSEPRDVGDESTLLHAATGLPVVVAAARPVGAALLKSAGVDLILCDDGLQHLRLARDVEIAIVDGGRGFGNGRLLPAGPMREPAARLARCDFVVVNGPVSPAAAAALGGRGGQGAFTMQLVPGLARRLGGDREERDLASFRGAPVHAVAAIGNPVRFHETLRAAGLRLIEHPFPDHHAFDPQDLRFDDDHPILMTSKDAVKCRAFADSRMWELPVAARLEPDAGLTIVEHVMTLLPRRGAVPVASVAAVSASPTTRAGVDPAPH
jgi:tetraacyldisaccharide 4'-kinase